ncbi:hypothetical protein R3W88_008430 [Solanum pinnatisectum]|uniref:Uncharacterized protein n=1 Tax=Solanum pinnatisectum TaxID=50273 RepID=A0AAV9M8F0_9SOLN|nr:hypothetical protein R3W88_008430 [Solanum pinnatisectum]
MLAHCITNLSVWNRIQRTSQSSINRDGFTYYLRLAPENYQNNISILDWWKKTKNNIQYFPPWQGMC